MKKFLSAQDVSNLDGLIEQSLRYKNSPTVDQHIGKGKTLGLLFFNPSLRTRISTQLAAKHLGMETMVFNVGQEGWALEFGEEVVMNGTKPEHIKDAAPVLGQYFDVIAVRTFPTLSDRTLDYSEHYINQFVQYCGIPVVSMESATLHPMQSAADLVTIAENFKEDRKPKIVLTWAPHIKPLPHCVSNSFAQWMNQWGKAEFVITHPTGYELKDEFSKGAKVTTDQHEALANADFVYVKNWCSYHDYGAMPTVHNDWMLTNEKIKITNQAKIMHCLPVRRGLELGSDVLDSKNSIVTQQAANRVWATQAVLHSILKSINNE